MVLNQQEIVGATHIVPTSSQGKYVGVIDIEMAPGDKPRMVTQKITMDGNVAEDKEVVEMVTQFTNKLKAQVNTRVVRNPQGTPASGKLYYSPYMCKNCHLSQYEDWTTSRHAQAMKTLVDEDRVIPECLSCHSEMYRSIGTAQIPANNVGGVDCASCHYDALPHGMERKTVAQRTKVDTKQCLVCHTKEWTPGFDEKTYLPKIAHCTATTTSVAGAASVPSSQH
jgi:hypothetical protein